MQNKSHIYSQVNIINPQQSTTSEELNMVGQDNDIETQEINMVQTTHDKREASNNDKQITEPAVNIETKSAMFPAIP